MITLAALVSIALIVAATEVVAHGLARVPSLGSASLPRYSVTVIQGVATLGFPVRTLL